MTAVDPEYAAVALAVRNQNRPLALQLAARALKGGHKHPLILVLAAEGLEERGQAEAATNLLRAATRGAPKHKVAWMRLAALLAKRQLFVEAQAAFDAALSLDPDAYPALMGAAEMRLLLRDLPGAQQRYERAAEIAPQAAAPLAVLALMAAQARDAPLGRTLAARALALEPGILGAEMALARADLLEAAPGPAAARAAALLGRSDLDDEHRVGALDIRAGAYDALGRAPEAFADYEARNAILLRLHGDRFKDDRPSEVTRRLTASLRAATDDAWRAAPGEDALGGRRVRRHVFLLGFPRSGTTLLEKALAGHPDIVSLEEVNHLASAGRTLGEGGWRDRPVITHAEADLCRETYWRGVGSTLGDALGDRILIDKLPLHTLALPLIARLFPDARILFALRDPRDVVLSCYRRRFQVNSAMFEYLTLAGAAEFYDAAMSLAMVARSRLPLNVLEVRHEAVIADFDGELGGILDFIGAGWNPAVRAFSDRVEGPARTPSYAQLARGLNADGIGQWRRYEQPMSPILPILAPWIERFGYGVFNQPAPPQK